MAQTVWDQLKANDSATCRSCHSYAAMDVLAQRPNAVPSARSPSRRKARPVSTATAVSPASCAGGLAAAGASELAQAAAPDPANVTTRYAIATARCSSMPQPRPTKGTTVTLHQRWKCFANETAAPRCRSKAGNRMVWRAEVFYAAPNKRILSVLVGDAAAKALVTSQAEPTAPPTSRHQVRKLTAWVDQSQLIGDQRQLWQLRLPP